MQGREREGTVVAEAMAAAARPSTARDPLTLPGVGAAAAAEFAELYRGTFTDLSRYCRALLRDDAHAADCAQEAFTRLFARWRTVRDPRGFLFLVATNLVRDQWRRSERDRALARRIGLQRAPEIPPVDPGLRDLVDRLPAPLADAVLLHYFADLPIDVVATLTRRPPGTIKRCLHEARAELRRLLDSDS